jgi:photosystem II stability/assembly factor-like uncharacterized protein
MDGGRHWRMVNAGLFDRAPLPPRTESPNGSAVGSLTIDAQHPATVYAGTGRGLFRTRNGGARWQLIASPLPPAQVCKMCSVWGGGGVSFAIDPNHAQTIYASWTKGGGYRADGTRYAGRTSFFVSSDGGESWRPITMSTPLAISALVLTGSGALLATDQSRPGVFRSTDGGTTWRPAGLPGETLDQLDKDPGSGTIYATANNGKAVFQTTDGGNTWQAASTTLAWYGTVTDPNSPATVYATAGGVMKSTDGGHTWAPADNGIVSTIIAALALAPGSPATLYAGTADGRVFASTDGGRRWDAGRAVVQGWTNLTALAADPLHPRTIFAGTLNGLFESTDAGAGWNRIQTDGLDDVATLALDPKHPGTMYVSACRNRLGCSHGGLLETVNGGATWRRTVLGRYENGAGQWRGGSAVESIAIDPREPNTVFAGTHGGGLYRSGDAGHSWHRVAIAHGGPTSHRGAPNSISTIAIDPRNPNTIYVGSINNGILKSADGGTTWATVNTGLTSLDITTLAIDPTNPQTIFASTQSGVFQSSDAGRSWQPYGRGLPAGGVAAFAIDPARRTLYAGTNGGGVDALPLGR